MTSSFYFLQADKNDKNHKFLDEVERFSEANKLQTYVIDRPLGDSKYSYNHKDGLVLLAPRHKIIFVNFSSAEGTFDDFVDDFIEDLGSISDKYRYKDIIGRPKAWKTDLVEKVTYTPELSLEQLHLSTEIKSLERQRVCELLISLLTGSINDIEKVKASIPESLLDKVKQKILLFDGEQTRFVYQQSHKDEIRIQGLSGTGKTELLLHKLKEIYVGSSDSKIAFTCHNKILADNLKRRIPDFFNFMKVEQQIKWNERLWCIHAWGSQNDRDSGIYRYICDKFNIPFYRYSYTMSFDKACTEALKALENVKIDEFAFDYMLIDESQDFPDSFFDLCEKVTKETVYIAGDIFQSIFDETITDSIDPDYLLSKCYRTDPRTLMFSHALSMGLFETKKLRWLEDPEWAACGYLVEKLADGQVYRLKRESLRRFEDLDQGNVNSVELVKTKGDFYQTVAPEIIRTIEKIRAENATVTPDDIGIILLDPDKSTYSLADALEQLVPRAFGWQVNKAYETKRRAKDELFVSNKNNVKGLEFPFVICVTARINSSYGYRNALYMTLTRSFIRTYFVTSEVLNAHMLPSIEQGLANINAHGFIEVKVPSNEEKARIKTTIKFTNSNMSFYDFVQKIFDEIGVMEIFRPNLLETVKLTVGDTFDYDSVKDTIQFNYKKMLEGSN